MRNIKTIFILVLSLILLFTVSCDTESKTGVKNNPPENDTEITGGETGSGGTGSSEEGDGGTETPTTPSETETTETIEIEAKDFPSNLLGTYRDDRVYPGYKEDGDTKLEYDKIKGVWHNDDNPGRGSTLNFTIGKWKKTTKGGKTIKLESEIDNTKGKGIITFDCETKTLSGEFTWIKEGVKSSFNGKKIN